jgi:hypothetical protein
MMVEEVLEEEFNIEDQTLPLETLAFYAATEAAFCSNPLGTVNVAE